jgi:hypothetical protein
MGKNQGRFGEFFRYLWLSSFQEGKFRIAVKMDRTYLCHAELQAKHLGIFVGKRRPFAAPSRPCYNFWDDNFTKITVCFFRANPANYRLRPDSTIPNCR